MDTTRAEERLVLFIDHHTFLSLPQCGILEMTGLVWGTVTRSPGMHITQVSSMFEELSPVIGELLRRRRAGVVAALVGVKIAGN